MKPILTPKDLAVAIGVSESSIKRWADEGRIEISRTAGGHRRIALAEAIRFVRSTNAILVRPDILGLNDVAALQKRGALSGADTSEDLYELLTSGAAEESRGLILSLYLSGSTIPEIVDGPLRATMQRIGRLWKHDESGIYIEHRAVDLALQAMFQLRSLLPQPSATAPLATGGGPAGDPYLLPTLGISLALQEIGFCAVNLGPDCPYSSWLEACQRGRPRLFWMSCSSTEMDDTQVAEWIHRLLEEIEPHTIVAVGGESAPRALLREHPRLVVGSTIAELMAFVRGLRLASAPSQS